MICKCEFCGLEKDFLNIGYFHSHKNHCFNNPNRIEYKGHPHSLETKRLMSEKRKLFLKEHPEEHPWKKLSKFKSKPCESLKSFLKEKGFTFEEECLVVPNKNYSADICFPNIMLIIEVNGNQHYDLEKSELKPYYQNRHNEMCSLGWNVIEVPYNQSYKDTFRTSLCSLITNNLSLNDFNETQSSLPYLKTLSDIQENKLNKKKEQIEKRSSLLSEYDVDSCGRIRTYDPSKSEWQERKNKILNCGIDLTKYGWVNKVVEKTGLTKTIIENTVKRFPEDFNGKVFVRKVSKTVDS